MVLIMVGVSKMVAPGRLMIWVAHVEFMRLPSDDGGADLDVVKMMLHGKLCENGCVAVSMSEPFAWWL
jgi:hypothetical protein